MQVFHGTIITCDDNNTVAQYLVEREGRIAYVGNELPAMYSYIPPIEVEGAIVPSFVDAFSHYANHSINQCLFFEADANSNANILDQLKVEVEKSRANIIVGYGASGITAKEGHLVLREQLDAVCPSKPVCIVKYDSNSCVANSALIHQVEDKITGLRGCNLQTGEMRQEAFHTVMGYVSKGLSTKKVIDAMMKTADDLAEKGIGLVYSAGGVGASKDLNYDMERSVAKGFDNGFQLRVSFLGEDVQKAVKKDAKRITINHLDGAFGTQDAAMEEPYENLAGNKGILFYSDTELIDFCKEANRAGLQIVLHAAGDAAFNQATRALQVALEDYPRFDHRHMIVQACLPTLSGLEICSKYKIMLCVQPALIYYPTETLEYLQGLLGERLEKLNPIRTCMNLGVNVAIGSDAPVTYPDPIVWIHNACNNNSESISVYEALRACTINGCVASFEERERGTLEMGKTCDIVFLSENPYEVPKENLKDIQVTKHYLSGKLYEHSKAGAMTTMLRGMFPQ